MDDEHLRTLRTSGLEKSRVIQERCQALFHEHHQSEASESFLKTIRSFCEYLDSCIENSTSAPFATLQQIITVLQTLGAHLEYVESGVMHKIPWSYIHPFENAIKKVCREPFKVLIRARWSYGYSSVMQDFYQLYAAWRMSLSGLGQQDKEGQLNESIRDLSPAFRIIEFPYLERMNILLHCLIGHEVGHIFTGQFVASKEEQVIDEIHTRLEALPDEDYTEADDLEKSKILEGGLYYWSKITEEILCDLFCIYIFGPAALFSIYEYAMHEQLDATVEAIESGYPPWRYRLRNAYELLKEEGVITLIDEHADSSHQFAPVKAKLREIHDTVKKVSIVDQMKDWPRFIIIFDIIEDLRDDALDFLRGKVTPDNLKELRDLDRIVRLMKRLERDIPPNSFSQENISPQPPTLNQIINASWFHRLSLSKKDQPLEEFRRSYKNQLRLTLKGIEMADIQGQFMDHGGVSEHFAVAVRDSQEQAGSEEVAAALEPSVEEPKTQGALARNQIIDLIEQEELVITPLFHPKEQIGNTSVDLRLGTEFIVMQKRAFPVFDPAEYKLFFRSITGYQDRTRIGYKKCFTIHPRSIVLGCSLEYIRLPEDLMCYVVGKSSWGRLGLVIATATKVDPGFRGCVTLELVNHGEVPIKLYPGLPIAQLVFHRTTSESKYEGDYNIAIGPEFPKLDKSTPDWTFWYPPNP